MTDFKSANDFFVKLLDEPTVRDSLSEFGELLEDFAVDAKNLVEEFVSGVAFLVSDVVDVAKDVASVAKDAVEEETQEQRREAKRRANAANRQFETLVNNLFGRA